MFVGRVSLGFWKESRESKGAKYMHRGVKVGEGSLKVL